MGLLRSPFTSEDLLRIRAIRTTSCSRSCTELSDRKNAGIVTPSAEKRDMLTESPTTDTPQSISRSKADALRLLNPWISGDRRTLEFELRRWRDGAFAQNRKRVDADSN